MARKKSVENASNSLPKGVINTQKSLQKSEEDKSDSPLNKAWNDVFEYIKTNIFQYTKEQKLPKALILRVKGLAYGQKYLRKPSAKHPEELKQIYSTEAVYWTSVYCTASLIKAFEKAVDENHKINLLCYILEQYINGIEERCKKLRENSNNVSQLTTENLNQSYNTLTYKPKTKKKNPLIEELNSVWK